MSKWNQPDRKNDERRQVQLKQQHPPPKPKKHTSYHLSNTTNVFPFFSSFLWLEKNDIKSHNCHQTRLLFRSIYYIYKPHNCTTIYTHCARCTHCFLFKKERGTLRKNISGPWLFFITIVIYSKQNVSPKRKSFASELLMMVCVCMMRHFFSLVYSLSAKSNFQKLSSMLTHSPSCRNKALTN